MSDTIKQRLLYILHIGLVEIRNLAPQTEKQKQVCALADILELIPGVIAFNKEEYLAIIREEFEKYAAKYNSPYEYHLYLDRDRSFDY